MTRVSVIIPTYNRAHFIVDTVKSVLNQTYPDCETIVVDDGSTDNTRDLLQPYMDRIRYIYQANGGVSSARNHGMREATGQYIAFLDSDDHFLPDKIAKQVAYMQANPDKGMVYCGRIRHHQGQYTSKLLTPYAEDDTYRLWIARCPMVPMPSVVMIRQDIVGVVGFFNEELPQGEDTDYFLRIAEKYPIGCLPEYLTNYYIHGKNTVQDPKGRSILLYHVAEHHLHHFDEAFQKQVRRKIYFRIANAYISSGQVKLGYSEWRKGISQAPLDPEGLLLLVRLSFRTIFPSFSRQPLRNLWNMTRNKMGL